MIPECKHITHIFSLPFLASRSDMVVLRKLLWPLLPLQTGMGRREASKLLASKAKTEGCGCNKNLATTSHDIDSCF